MSTEKKATNPFYVLLVLLGIIFAITTCAYGVMAVKMSTAAGISEVVGGDGLMPLMNRHGLSILLVELVLLALATFGAIGTDNYWTKRNSQEPPHDAPQ